MTQSRQNLLLIAAAAILVILPLVILSSPAPTVDGSRAEVFTGADHQVEGVIQQLNPDYRPWFSPLMTPPSGEIESLLFALQAALGAGAIGYYLGFSRGRAKRNERGGDTSGVA